MNAAGTEKSEVVPSFSEYSVPPWRYLHGSHEYKLRLQLEAYTMTDLFLMQ